MSAAAFARHTDPQTSHDAAERTIAPGLEPLILAVLKKGPATMQDCAARLGVQLVSVSPRFAQLRRKGQIVDSLLRDMTSRFPRIIWRIA